MPVQAEGTYRVALVDEATRGATPGLEAALLHLNLEVRLRSRAGTPAVIDLELGPRSRLTRWGAWAAPPAGRAWTAEPAVEDGVRVKVEEEE